MYHLYFSKFNIYLERVLVVYRHKILPYSVSFVLYFNRCHAVDKKIDFYIFHQLFLGSHCDQEVLQYSCLYMWNTCTSGRRCAENKEVWIRHSTKDSLSEWRANSWLHIRQLWRQPTGYWHWHIALFDAFILKVSIFSLLQYSHFRWTSHQGHTYKSNSGPTWT